MVYRIPALLAAMTIHEYSHARAAVAMGDPTPRFLGRLTLNPISHIDPVGLLLLFVAGFGWAKPVPINPRNFHDGRKGVFIVSLAGAAANIALGFVAFFFLNLLYELNLIGVVWQKTLMQLYRYNLMFAVFNLIPIPPLDGSKILAGVLPAQAYNWLMRNERYIGIGFLLVFVMSPRLIGTVIGFVANPIISIIDFPLNALYNWLVSVL